MEGTYAATGRKSKLHAQVVPGIGARTLAPVAVRCPPTMTGLSHHLRLLT